MIDTEWINFFMMYYDMVTEPIIVPVREKEGLRRFGEKLFGFVYADYNKTKNELYVFIDTD